MFKLKLLKLFSILIVFNECFSNSHSLNYNSKITNELEDALKRRGFANIFISFNEGTRQVLEQFETLTFSDRTERINTLVESLEQNALKTQEKLKEFLTGENVNFKSFWISNQVYIKDASEELVHKISEFQEVSLVNLEIIAKIPENDETFLNLNNNSKKMNTSDFENEDIQWGISKIGADAAWGMSRGSRVKIGIIDTGIRWTHERIRHNYVGRNQNGWLDPLHKTTEPTEYSTAGHGTHVTGIALGAGGIGVAPDARFLGCVGCYLACELSDLIECGQFMLCPTDTNGENKDCSFAPDIVSNSYGGLDNGVTYFDEVINAWNAAQIIPVFGMGNSGPFCATGYYPGTSKHVITVGAVGIEDNISSFSSKGPNNWGDIKPDLCAPGEMIVSAAHTSDTALVALQGTSMATPFVSGVIALLISRYENRDLETIKRNLEETADKNLDDYLSCIAPDNKNFPNNVFGHGRVNALRAIQEFKVSGAESQKIPINLLLFSMISLLPFIKFI